MRFAHAHKLSSYLMAMCAFFALVTSGELGDGVSLLTLVAAIGSWWWEPPRIEYPRFALAWTLLSLVVLAYTLLMIASGGDVLVVGAEFLLYLMVAKLFNRRACKDYQQVYILSFLILVAGTVLNAEFTYGLFFLGYVISATWALILFHLRREMEDNFLLKHSDDRSSERVEVKRILNSRRIVGRRFFLGTSVVSLTIFALASVMFLMIPRYGIGVFFAKGRGGITLAGFRDGVKLGGHGTIKNDTTVVMRVKVDEAFEGRRAPYLHWRGVAFDRYEKGEWRRSSTAPPTRRYMTYPERGTEYHHLLYASPLRSTKELDRRLEGAVRQEIYLEPIGHDVLFGASMPLAFAFESKVGVRSPRKERNDEIRLSHSAGIKYEVYSQVQPPAPERLRGAPDRVPQTYQHYLQLPPEITQRTRDLAREITRDARTNYDKAVAIETWLRKNLRYTLQMRSPGDQEPIDFFLFERQRGHCEYFSSAMAILSRAVGVPTRNVNGFLGGEWNEYNDYIAVRAGDAHSWVEVYFYGVGWVTFDPTPPAQVDRLGRGSGGVRAKLARFVDTLRFKWFKWVIEYDLYRQFSLFRKIGSSLRGGASSVKSLMGGVKRTLVDHRRGLFSAIVAGLLLALVITVLRRRRGGPIAFRRAARRAPIAALYASIAQRLARCGHSRPRSMTPREYAARLERLAVPGAADMTRLTDLYYAAVYSGAPDDADMVEAERLRAAIGEALRGYKAPRKGAKSSKAAKDEATDSTAAEPTAAESAVAEAADRGAQETDK